MLGLGSKGENDTYWNPELWLLSCLNFLFNFLDFEALPLQLLGDLLLAKVLIDLVSVVSERDYGHVIHDFEHFDLFGESGLV